VEVKLNKQIHIKLDEKLHKEVRLKAAEVGQTIQEYVQNTLQLRVNEQTELFTNNNEVPLNGKHSFTFIDLFAGIGGTR
tara:strand:+ start:315 stop:551 length:237 start_codon:yes stop_codon:yes gene_type:complete